MELLQRLISSGNLWIAVVAIAMLLLGVVIWQIVINMRKSADTRKITKIMKMIGTEFLQSAYIPDGVGGYACIDYLVLMPGGILVVNVQNYNGFIFGGENMDQWTQMIDSKSYKFDNPLGQNFAHVQAVKTLTSNIPVEGRIVFSAAGEFPRGIPKGVSMVDTIKADIAYMLKEEPVPEPMQSAWQQLQSIAQETAMKVKRKRI